MRGGIDCPAIRECLTLIGKMDSYHRLISQVPAGKISVAASANFRRYLPLSRSHHVNLRHQRQHDCHLQHSGNLVVSGLQRYCNRLQNRLNIDLNVGDSIYQYAIRLLQDDEPWCSLVPQLEVCSQFARLQVWRLNHASVLAHRVRQCRNISLKEPALTAGSRSHHLGDASED
jgi:hypothetical protein